MLYFNYEIIYYAKRGSFKSPVEEYSHGLDVKERSEMHKMFHLLLKYDGRLPPPYAKHIYDKLWELRVRYKNRHHRLFYFIGPKKKIVLLTAFLKKSRKTPRSEIIKAHKYYLDYLSSL